MATKNHTRTSSYAIANVRKAGGPNEYVVTVTRDGKPTGEVKVRAPSSAPSYFDDVNGKKVLATSR